MGRFSCPGRILGNSQRLRQKLTENKQVLPRRLSLVPSMLSNCGYPRLYHSLYKVVINLLVPVNHSLQIQIQQSLSNGLDLGTIIIFLPGRWERKIGVPFHLKATKVEKSVRMLH